MVTAVCAKVFHFSDYCPQKGVTIGRVEKSYCVLLSRLKTCVLQSKHVTLKCYTDPAHRPQKLERSNDR